jgi:hypothetical protein
MVTPSKKQCDAIAERLAYLLDIDESGWNATASWLDSRALEDGLDLFAQYESPKAWAFSVVDRLRDYIDVERFSEGISSLEAFETAGDLFWTIFPDWRRSGL